MTDKFDWLREHVAGGVFVPGDVGYDAECFAYNLLTPLAPPIVVGAASVADVEAGVRFAAAHEMPIAVRGGGHHQPRAATDALLITLDRMTEVRIDEDGAAARVAGGARWQDVLAAATPLGLAAAAGSAPTVGAIGYVLGCGRSPMLGRAFGYASDHVTEFEVVTADGVRRTADEVENADLFQALKGSRGNFGVVTAMRIALFPVATMYAGNLSFGPAQAERVIKAWRDWARTLPDEATTSVAIRPGECAIRYAFAGPAERGAALLAPMRALSPITRDAVAEVPFADAAAMHGDPPMPPPFHDLGMGLHDLPAEAIAALVGAGAVAELSALGGALDRAPAPDVNPARGLPYQLIAVARDTGSLDRLENALAPWRDDRQQPNSMTRRQIDVRDVRRVYGAELFGRLAALKAKYDPDNLFRVNFNIPPVRTVSP
nr:FAD-binding protein [uncultured Actinoplanes sp.]